MSGVGFQVSGGIEGGVLGLSPSIDG
jgi:hypothetical protein